MPIPAPDKTDERIQALAIGIVVECKVRGGLVPEHYGSTTPQLVNELAGMIAGVIEDFLRHVVEEAKAGNGTPRQ